MTKIRSFLQHTLNPLHVYCRLRTIGISRETAVTVSNYYERAVYRRVLA